MLSTNDEGRIKRLEDRISFLEDENNIAPPKAEKWYENIPEGGVIGIGENSESDKRILSAVTSYNYPNGRPYYGQGYVWEKFTPLTKQEIQVFKDNAPDTEG